MSKIQKSQATIAIENLINSEEYKTSSKKFYKTQLIIAQMNEIIEKKHLRQEDVAKRMEMSQSNLSRLLNGNRPKFSFETIMRFCDATESSFTLL